MEEILYRTPLNSKNKKAKQTQSGDKINERRYLKKLNWHS
jgi:hypothetical protein